MPRRRQQEEKGYGRRKPDRPDRHEGDAPVERVGDEPGDHAAAHPADRRRPDIEAHREPEPGGFGLFGQIGHGDGGHAAERHAFERP